MIKLINNLMVFIGIICLIIFLVLFWTCYSAPEMSMPFTAIRLIWLPTLPAFVLFIIVAWAGLFHHYRILPTLAVLSPIIIVRGAMGFSGITATLSGQSLYFLDANILGLLEIIFGGVSLIAWFIWHRSKYRVH